MFEQSPRLIKKPKIIVSVDASQELEARINIEDANYSTLSPYPVILLLLLPQWIATHERTKRKRLKTVDYSHGWERAPIAAVTWHDEIFTALKPGVHVVESVSEGAIGAGDGHHRRQEGINKMLNVFASLTPLNSEHLVIETHRRFYKPRTPQQVQANFTRAWNLPPRATSFQVIGTDGVTRHVSEYQQHVTAPRSVLETQSS